MTSQETTRLDLCANALTSACLHLIRPEVFAGDFSSQYTAKIQPAWEAWRDEEIAVHRSAGTQAPERIFPTPPPEGKEYAPCLQMWGCMVLSHGDQYYQCYSLGRAVEKILASPACKNHPPSCPCKVPNNPWTHPECVAELNPLGVKHNPKCECAPCKQVVQKSPYNYEHKVDECACGTCHKARVDSGTQEAYEARIRARQRPVPVHQSISSAACNADLAIMKASALAGGIDKPDFAKHLFAAMGTPHDSLCPHGLPFYSCMPCSH